MVSRREVPVTSLSDAAATAARDTLVAPGGSPFDRFATSRSLTPVEASRFLEYVTACGGGAHTDLVTLDTLYDIWIALGRHG